MRTTVGEVMVKVHKIKAMVADIEDSLSDNESTALLTAEMAEGVCELLNEYIDHLRNAEINI